MSRLSLPALAALVVTFAAPAFANDERGQYDTSHVFKVTRDGSEIGSHRLTFVPTQEGLRVDIAIELRVGLGRAITLYRYRHTASELWRDGQLVRLSSTTDDNGKAYAVTAERAGGGLAVRVSQPRDDDTIEARSAGNQKRALDVPVAILPTSHWRRAFIENATLLNTQLGTLAKIRAEKLGTETIATECASLTATRYRLSGDLTLDIWFDDRDRWVKLVFAAPDGSKVDYTLRCPGTG